GLARAPDSAKMVTAGTGLGTASWALVSSKRSLVFSLPTHRAPDGSKAIVVGPYMPLVKVARGATSALPLVGYTSTSPLASTPFPPPLPPKIAPPWETTSLPGAKCPTPEG